MLQKTHASLLIKASRCELTALFDDGRQHRRDLGSKFIRNDDCNQWELLTTLFARCHRFSTQLEPSQTLIFNAHPMMMFLHPPCASVRRQPPIATSDRKLSLAAPCVALVASIAFFTVR